VKGATVPVLNFAINFINEELGQDSMSEIEKQYAKTSRRLAQTGQVARKVKRQ